MKTKYPSPPVPTLAQRALELQTLAMPGAQISFSGRELHFRVVIAPGRFGRLYRCLLKVKPDSAQPDMLVLEPDLETLAGGRKIPHTYAYDGKGTKRHHYLVDAEPSTLRTRLSVARSCCMRETPPAALSPRLAVQAGKRSSLCFWQQNGGN